MDLRPVRLGMLAPNGGCGPLWKQRVRSVGRPCPPAAATSRRRPRPPRYIHGRCSGKWSNCGQSDAGSIPRNGAAELPSTCAWSASSVATGSLHLLVESRRHRCPARHSNPMPITVPNYNLKTDRHPFGTLIDIPRNPHKNKMEFR